MKSFKQTRGLGKVLGDGKYKLPVVEMLNIQEALLPLGYAVHRYEQDPYTEYDGITLRLFPLVDAVFGDNSTISADINDSVGADSPGNSF